MHARLPAPCLISAAGLLLMALAVAPPAAIAGTNAGGSIFVAWNPAISYPGHSQFIDGGLRNCGAAVLQAPAAVTFPVPDAERRVWFAYAAFPPGSLPRLKGVAFGIKFSPFHTDTGVNVLWAALEPSVIGFPSPGWPTLTNSGTVIVFPNVRTGLLEQLCVFAGYGSMGARFAVGKHPTIATQFADDAIPPNIDDVAGFGSLGFGVEGYRDCPPPALGACCRVLDGICLLLSPAACLEEGGSYQGNATVCDPNPCPQPTGACCFENEHCEIQTEARCAEYGGLWMGPRTLCQPYPCPPPPPSGACCYPDGSCGYVREMQCTTGDWRLEIVCTPNPCPQTSGACCNLETGECALLALVECEAATFPHQWMGAAIECDPSPCPAAQVYGACCLQNNVCAYLTFADCRSFDWRPNEACTPNPCTHERGACCFNDNRCEFVFREDCTTGRFSRDRICQQVQCTEYAFGACCDIDNEVCVILTRASCDELGSTHWWVGANTTCDANPCMPPAPGGSCCFSDGSCRWMPLARCDHHNWTMDQPCEPNPCPPPGACCYNGGFCYVTQEEWCSTGEWTVDLPCEPNPCPPPGPPGACCYNGGFCYVTEEEQCSTGAWTVGFPCEPNPCLAPGACCNLVTGACRLLSWQECAAEPYPQHWGGATTTCSPDPCSVLLGACCSPDGGCLIRTSSECDGTWVFGSECGPDLCAQSAPGACCESNGDCYFIPYSMCGWPRPWHSYADCDPSPCANAPVGACCDPQLGSCTLLAEWVCRSAYDPYVWLGPGTGCDPNPCPQPTGACCILESCQVLTEAACAAAGGFYQGYGSSCTPDLCVPVRIGACCRPDGECFIHFEVTCQPPDRWVGGECQPNPCGSVPVDRTSWGRIKARFR